MINYTYKLSNLEVKDVDDKSNVVHVVHVEVYGVDEDTGIQENVIEKYDVEIGDLESFTEYDSLTEDTVLSWIEDERYSGVRDSIELLIETKIESLSDNPLPWKVLVEPEVAVSPLEIDPPITGDTPDLEE